MPIPQLNRRSYGFTNREPERPSLSYGEKRYQQPDSRGPWPVLKKSLIWLLVLPFRLIGWLFSLLGWLWYKRPRLNKAQKQAARAKLGWIILTIFVFTFLGGTIMVAWASRDLPDPDKLTDRKVAQSTKIYDRTGTQLLYEVFSDQKRTLVDFEKIPRNLINGVIATEDAGFYEHSGIRPLGWVRAVFYGIFTGKKISGTSTLTQQLVKNAILTTQRSYIRKIKEIILSIRLEQKYSKDQILKIYFNEIPYGSTNYGVEAASQSYFGKHVWELDLAESATLAGLPKAPTYYLNNLDVLKQRRDFVLRRMFEEGYINEVEKNSAQSQPFNLERHYGDIKAPHFVLYVKEQLVERFGEQAVDTGGLRVITTLDWQKQLIAETAVSSSAKNLSASQADNAALVALDPKTSQILAMVGSRDFFNEEIDGQFNVAVQGKRQPGSSFKPIVYAAAFEKGYTADTVLWDVSTNFAVSGKPYQPIDYDEKERGPVTIRQALQGSLNIPAVETLYLVGPKAGVEFAERLGYTTLSEGEFGLSLVLGGGEVRLLEHANAYVVFANNGVKNETVSILKVEASDGDVLYGWKAKKGEEVLDEKITATLSNILSDDSARAYIFGAGGILTLPGRPAAVKTGTTNNYTDAWTVGYTPSLVAGVWVGRTDNKPMRQGDGGSKLAAPIWNQFMRESLKNQPVENFSAVPSNDADKPILRGSAGGKIVLLINKLTGKIATSTTPVENIIEKTYLPAHSILHYVDKDNPRGPLPEHPELDPQYAIWEAAIQDWARREREKNPDWDISFEDLPAEYDDAHSVNLMPTVEILNPAEGQTLSSREIIVEIKASAPRGIAKVVYKIDGRQLKVVKEYPFNLSYYAPELVNGSHNLFVIAEDDLGNYAEKSVSFNLQAGEEQQAVFWVEKNAELSQSDFPRAFFLNHFRLPDIAELRIYKEINGQKDLILTKTDFSDLFNNHVVFKWNETPAVGQWLLIAEVKLKTGPVIESGRLTVTVE